MIVANTLAWALLHAIWEGAAIALTLAVLLRFLRSPKARYLAGCIALAATLAGFVVTFIHLMPSDYLVARPVWSLRAVPLGAGSVQLTPGTPGGIVLPPWITPLWLAGVALFQLRALGGWLAVRRLRRTGVCVVAEHWQTRLGEMASNLGINKPVALLQSSLAEVPVVIGHLRPVILMPLGLLTGLPCGQIETILMHELAHIRRHDYLVNLLQTFAEGLLFYHPAVWWMSRVIRTERENCCDDVVVAVNADAHEYAVALAALAENRWATRDVAMAATGGSLVKRIRRLLKQPEVPRAGLMPVVTAMLIVIMFGFGLLAWQSQPPKAAAPWTTKWLTEDVAYIITDAERNAFKQLGTDEEREKFVEQFWLRRDPTPGTIENEFKEEHYRRIAFANDHFSEVPGLPGWKTDRGRIYITFGPPDEIDAHPSGDANRTDPYENWRYRLLEGIGNDVLIEFVGGDYHMTMDPNAAVGFRSVGPGPQMLVAVRSDRTLRIIIPIVPGETQFSEFTRITTPSGVPIGTQEFQGSLAPPRYEIEWRALDPGTYTLTTAVTDSPSGKVHTYTVAVTVK